MSDISQKDVTRAVAFTALVIVGLVAVFLGLVLISARFKKQVILRLEAAKRPLRMLQQSHPNSWRMISRVMNALCRLWMFVDMGLDGALCIALYNDKVGDTNPGLWTLSLLVWMCPYFVLWLSTFHIFWRINQAWLKQISWTGKETPIQEKAGHRRRVSAFPLAPGNLSAARYSLLFLVTFIFGLPGVLIMDILLITVFLFSDFAHTEYLVHYERLRYLVEAMIEGPLGLIFEIFVLLKSSHEESGIELDPLLLPFSIAIKSCSMVYQIMSIRAVAANSQKTFFKELLTLWKVGVGSLPYIDGIATGKLHRVSGLLIDSIEPLDG
jgi:hypothetical protein